VQERSSPALFTFPYRQIDTDSDKFQHAEDKKRTIFPVPNDNAYLQLRLPQKQSKQKSQQYGKKKKQVQSIITPTLFSIFSQFRNKIRWEERFGQEAPDSG
jgi:hypothetical protein